MLAQSLERKQASNLSKPVQSNKSDKLVQKEKVRSKNTKFQNSALIENFTVNSPDADILYTAIPLESASESWNDLNRMVFGSFYQNDTRFSELSRGYQCTCNALCMLAFSICLDVEKTQC